MPRDKENQKRIAKEWYERNKELTKERARAWTLANPEKVSVKNIKYKTKNKKEIAEYNKKWWSENKPKRAAYQSKRKAAQLQRTPKWLTDNDLWMIEEAFHLAELRTKLFGFPWHVDHIIPLQGKKVSGLHVPSNIQVIPAKENTQKSNKFAI